MLVAAESCDYLAPQSGPDYNNPQFNTLGWYQIVGALNVDSNTRFGYGYSMKFQAGVNNGSNAAWLFPNAAQLENGFVGVAMYIDEANENDAAFISLNCSVGNLGCFTVVFRPFGVIELGLGKMDRDSLAPGPEGAIIFQSAGGTYRLNTWFYFEIGFTIDPDTMTPNGAIELRVNTVPVADYINIQSSVVATFADNIAIGLKSIPDGASKLVYWDDWYVCDDQGAHNTTFLGNTRVQGLLPNAPGDNTDWDKVGAATNWQAASNQLVDDSKYVFSGVTDDYDLYEIAPLVNSPNVFGVQVKGAYRQDDATQRFAVNTIKSGATQADGTPVACNSSYAFQFDIWEEDPDTMMTWDYTAVNTLQIGPKVES